MGSVPATCAQCVLLVWGLERFAAAATTLAAATEDVVRASRDELRLRRCAASLAHRANLAAAALQLTRLAPSEARRWGEAAARVLDRWENAHEEATCIATDWGAVAHLERNPALPDGWPNWRARFVRVP